MARFRMRHMTSVWSAPLPVTMLAALTFMLSPDNANAATAAGGDLEAMRARLSHMLDRAAASGLLTEAQVETVREVGTTSAAAPRTAAATDATTAPIPPAVAAIPADETIDDPVEAVPESTVRVSYVPEIVQRRISERVRSELREEMTDEVMARAKEQGWGVPAGLPDWVTALRITGDARISGVADFPAADNVANSQPNFNAINRAGGITQAGSSAFVNTTESSQRMLARLRLGLNITLADQFDFGLRLGTQNNFSPVSLNQSLGAYGSGYQVALDRLYVRWSLDRDAVASGFAFSAGRLPNPYTTTDLLWDEDLNFDGVALHARVGFGRARSATNEPAARQTFYLVGGGFALDEAELAIPDGSSNDKWLYGGQLGYLLRLTRNTSLNLAGGYHRFANVAGRRNTFGSTLLDWTAPSFLQKGNTLFDIRNDNDPDTNLFALAADFTVLDGYARLRYEGFAPVVVTVTGGYVNNIGFDAAKVQARTGTAVAPRTEGYSIGLDVGHLELDRFAAWSLFGSFRYLQRDAVIDAFTDSDFRRGGTDMKGWLVGGRFALARNVWLAARWWSADAIDGVPLGIDSLQVDLNVKY